MDIIIRDISFLLTRDGVLRNRDVLIRGGRVEGIAPTGEIDATQSESLKTIRGKDRAVLAGLKNGHTHAAMTLLRGYGDDMPLQEWLQNRIWPAERRLTSEDLYWGTRLAALEMIKGGTTFANDMYFEAPEVWRAFRDAGVRAAVGLALFDFGDATRRRETMATVDRFLAKREDERPHAPVFATIAPHSIYTCSGELLSWAARRAEECGLVFHIHMSETEREVAECLSAHGMRPFQWLDSLGVTERVGARSVVAHGVWLDASERSIVADSGMTIAHNPASNMKLASGALDWRALREAGVPMMLAPDGVASNNNLDMFEEMKLASLLQKHHFGDATRLDAATAVDLAVGEYTDVFSPWGVGGHLFEGTPADLIVVSLDHPQMCPVHNIESNLAYAANGSMVETAIIGGRIAMEDRVVDGEAEVIAEAARCAGSLVRRIEQ
ncbi:MAG: amidohydrolase [Spirochaetales bacterium]|nr:amidohydrolase [Spirochaetales bacterium]